MFPRQTSNGSNGTDCQLLAHLDGTSGGTTLTDSSPAARTLTCIGSGALSNTQVMFGPTSFYCGSGGFNAADSAALRFGSSDFTLDFWMYLGSLSPSGTLVAKRPSGGIGAFIFYNNGGGTGNIDMYLSSTGSSWDLAGPSSLGTVTTGWSHIAVTRVGTTVYPFINGILGTTVSVGSSALYNDTNSLSFGSENDGGLPLDGYIDEVHVLVGKGLWTASFPVKTSPWG